MQEAAAPADLTEAAVAEENTLPYGGSMQEAMRAQDRAAIRTLMAAGSSAAADTAAPPLPTEEERSSEEAACPVCRELIYKPTVNSCGHTFCFWCLHRSMDPLDCSSCPICRAPFVHLPAPCLALHLHLNAAFPAEYAHRAAETLANETEWQTSSPQLATEGEPDWSCVECRRTPAKHTRVSVCGHLTCADCFDIGLTRPCASCAARQVYVPKPCRLICALHGDEAPAEAPSPQDAEAEACAPEASSHASPDPPAGGAAAAERAYVHFGVGCDGCGIYPITGLAWKCQECPDAVGYDLCDDCHGAPLSAGRFGQSHLPAHRMEEREQVQTLWHTLAAANPEMSLRDIVQLVEVARAAQQRMALLPQELLQEVSDAAALEAVAAIEALAQDVAAGGGAAPPSAEEGAGEEGT